MVARARGSGTIAGLRKLALAGLLLLALLAAARPATGLLYGGPIIDASVYGNKEFFPGQTAPLLVEVQNSGYLQTLYGYKTPEQLLLGATASYSASSNYSAEQGQYEAAGYSAAAGAGGLAGGAGTAAGSIAQSEGSSSYSYTQTGALGDLEINTGAGTRLAATTALGLTCQLAPGDAPVQVISSDRMLCGSLAPGQLYSDTAALGLGGLFGGLVGNGIYQPMQFWLRVAPDAKPGHYVLPLVVTYKHLSDDYSYASIFGPVVGQSNFVQEVRVLPLDIVIMPRFDLVLSNMVCTDLVPDTDGTIAMTVTNLGSLPVEHAVAYLMNPTLGASQEDLNYPLKYQQLSYQAYSAEQPRPVPQTMLVPVQNSQYLGHLDPGEARAVTFEVSVSSEARSSDIPMSAVVSYNDAYDEEKSSNVETFGVHVEPEMRFAVDAAPVQVKCGRSCVANLTLTNNGTNVAHDAIVRMNALDPFTVSYDTMYLGDVAPGENSSAPFGIKVKPDAVPGTYYVTLEVKYYDGQDDPHVTKVIRKAIVVLPPPTLPETIRESWPLALGLALLALLGLGYLGYKWLRSLKKLPAAQAALPSAESGSSGGGGDRNM